MFILDIEPFFHQAVRGPDTVALMRSICHQQIKVGLRGRPVAHFRIHKPGATPLAGRRPDFCSGPDDQEKQQHRSRGCLGDEAVATDEFDASFRSYERARRCVEAVADMEAGPETSRITHLFAGVPVSDLDASIDWYTRLFGRPPDHRVGHEMLWELDEHA